MHQCSHIHKQTLVQNKKEKKTKKREGEGNKKKGLNWDKRNMNDCEA